MRVKPPEMVYVYKEELTILSHHKDKNPVTYIINFLLRLVILKILYS